MHECIEGTHEAAAPDGRDAVREPDLGLDAGRDADDDGHKAQEHVHDSHDQHGHNHRPHAARPSGRRPRSHTPTHAKLIESDVFAPDFVFSDELLIQSRSSDCLCLMESCL